MGTMPEELELMSPGRRWDREEMGGASSNEEDTHDGFSDPAEEEIQTLLQHCQSMPIRASSLPPLVIPPISSSTTTSSSKERYTPPWDKNDKNNTSFSSLSMPAFAPVLSPRTRSGPARLFQRGATPSPLGASSSSQHHHSSHHAHPTANGGGGSGGRDGGRDGGRRDGGREGGREGGHFSAPPAAGTPTPRASTPRGKCNKGISGTSECSSNTSSTSTITSTNSGLPSNISVLHRGTSNTTPTPRRRTHGRVFVIVFVVFTAAVLFLLFLVTILHISLMRHAASTRLGNVLAIIESAEYYPIRNGLHSERPDLQRRYQRLLLETQGGREGGREGGRGLAAGGGEVVMAEMDGNGEATVVGGEGEGGREEGVERVLAESGGEEEGGEVGRREGEMAEEEGERNALMGDLWKHRPSRSPRRPQDPPAKLCSVTYKMNLSEHEAKAIDLDPYDQELLGTIMVRLCNCGCARDDTVSLSSSSPPSPSLPPSPPHVDSLTLMSEILRGAHIVVEGDHGAFYSWFTNMQDSYRRTSSHRSIVPMYGIDEGSVLRTILTGRTGDGHTWLQFEGAGWEPFKRPFESFLHAINYVQYRVTGKQVGPLGVSAFTDHRPIRLRFDGCLDGGMAGGTEGGQVRRGLLFEQMEKEDPRGKEGPPSVGRDIERVVRKGRSLLFSNSSSSSLPFSSSSFSSPSVVAGPVGMRAGGKKKEGGREGGEERRRLRRKAKA